MSVSGQSPINRCLWEIGKGLIGVLSTWYCLEALKKKVSFCDILQALHISDNEAAMLGALVAFPASCDLTLFIYLPLALTTVALNLRFSQYFFFGKTHSSSFQCDLFCLCWFTDQSAFLVLLPCSLVSFINFLRWQIFTHHGFMQNISVLCTSDLSVCFSAFDG